YEGSVAPLYADARYFFKMKCVNPFIMFDGGVIFAIAGEPAKTGPFVFLGGGARVPIAQRVSLTAAAGPYLHWNDKAGARDALLSLKVGLVFH
ncbi:MAG: hypothetical protein JXB49_00335, partial [Bacteroidales bacterium]|nr:hypothetical protein [Bacteroidales bacterium]